MTCDELRGMWATLLELRMERRASNIELDLIRVYAIDEQDVSQVRLRTDSIWKSNLNSLKFNKEYDVM